MTSDDTQREHQSCICYFLVCFDNVEFVAFLLAAVYRRQDVFFIHCDPKARSGLKKYVEGLSLEFENVFLVAPQDYSWAGFSHVSVTLSAMKQASSSGRNWDHFVVLSEQHLPLKSPGEIAACLREDGTRLRVRRCTDMAGVEFADMENRFGAVYRELQGVGSFAIDAVERSEEFYQSIYHGSNWFALARADCKYLLDRVAMGDMQLFEKTVHAEETAIQSILGKKLLDAGSADATLVAEPWMTDNSSLIMTDTLFFENTGGNYLFIRKRQKSLSDKVGAFIRSRHFEQAIYDRRLDVVRDDGRTHAIARTSEYLSCLHEHLSGFGAPLVVNAISCEDDERKPSFHVMITSGGMLEKHSVRVLSEDGIHFKVAIAKEQPFGPFVNCRGNDEYVVSTLRVRVYGLFGYQEILPRRLLNMGFITVEEDESFDALTAEILCFLHEAVELRLAVEEGRLPLDFLQ